MTEYGVGFAVERSFIKIGGENWPEHSRRTGKRRPVPKVCSYRRLKWALQVVATYLYNERNSTTFSLPKEEHWIRANTRDKTYFGERVTKNGRRKAINKERKVLRLWQERRHAETGKRLSESQALGFMCRTYAAGVDGKDAPQRSALRSRRSRARKADKEGGA